MFIILRNWYELFYSFVLCVQWFSSLLCIFASNLKKKPLTISDFTQTKWNSSTSRFTFRKLLTGLGYTVEECRIQETGLLQNCVIYEPVMEDISSTSEASGYDSDFTKYQLNEESLSDWDDPHVKRDSEKPDKCKGKCLFCICSHTLKGYFSRSFKLNLKILKKIRVSSFAKNFAKIF